MTLHSSDRFSKDYKTANRMAHDHAVRTAERFNEPAHVLEGPDEFFVVRGISWDYRAEWGSEGWPKWAKDNPEEHRVETAYPEDKLEGKYSNATERVTKMQDTVRDVRWEQSFDLEEMCRDYPDVRLALSLSQSAGDHYITCLTHLQWEVEKAIKQHKEKTDAS